MLPFELTKDTPYLALSGELWSVFLSTSTEIDRVIKGFYCDTMKNTTPNLGKTHDLTISTDIICWFHILDDVSSPSNNISGQLPSNKINQLGYDFREKPSNYFISLL